MLELLDNSYSLLFATHNEGKSVIVERFRKTSKSKIYKRITADNSKSYLPYLNKLVDEYNNTYHHYINKTPNNADCFALTEKIESNPKAPKFKINDRVNIIKF